MNKAEQNFQKRLAVWQLFATLIVTLGAVIFAYGLSLLLFSIGLEIDSVEGSEDAKYALDIISKMFLKTGMTGILVGVILLLSSLLIIIVINKEKIKPKKSISSKHQILFDEMYDGKEVEFTNKGYDTFSVKKIRLTDKSLQSDYSILKYVEENNMILVTEDTENYGGCLENELPCIKLGQNPTVDEIEKALESLKSNYSKR